jgi:hypothetical protein
MKGMCGQEEMWYSLYGGYLRGKEEEKKKEKTFL